MNQSMVEHWYAICFVSGGPMFKSRQGRELLILNKKEIYSIVIQTLGFSFLF